MMNLQVCENESGWNELAELTKKYETMVSNFSKAYYGKYSFNPADSYVADIRKKGFIFGAQI